MIYKEITRQVLENAYSYTSYRALLDQLMVVQKTTGPNQDEWLIDYAKLNIARMKKWEKSSQLSETIKLKLGQMSNAQIWLSITEGWCGDAAQIIPIIEKLAISQPLVMHKIILRDEHPNIIDQFLTNGGRAIPITIILDPNNLNVLGHWGPRPSGAQNIMNQLKTNPEIKKEALMENLHAWYAKDKSMQIQDEFLNLLLKTTELK